MYHVHGIYFQTTLLLSRGVTDFQTVSIQGEMKAAQDPVMEDVVHAEFYPNDDSVMEAVLSAFYTQVS